MKLILLLAFCLSSFTIIAGTNPIQINEVMSSNGGSLTDLSGDSPDWIEFYNSGTTPMNLNGYGLTDKITEPFQWTFPSYTLNPGKYLVVFASGKNLKGSELHTNFKIDANGESIYLFSPGWSIVDSVRVEALKINTSYGRTNKDRQVWGIFTTSTPRNKNADESFPNIDVGKPDFSIPGGVYSNQFKVKLTPPSLSDTIYYTTNNSIPTRYSAVYSGEFSINKSKIIKARIIKTGFIPGETVTNSYIFSRSSLPVVALSIDSLDLWDYNTGIYAMGPNPGNYPYFGANFWQDWEKPCHFELMDPNKKVIDVDAGVKIFGNWSRANNEKSMAVHCRKKYGPEYMEYKIFNNRPFDKFYSIVMRNSGGDWNNTMFRDGLMTSLTVGLNFEQMAYRPASIFLNGQYWGILNLREKIDENFLASNNGVDPNKVILLENEGQPLIGSADDWRTLYSFLERSSMAVEANYDQVASQIDISSFIDYFASQIFYANHDWPGNNIRYWKTTDLGSKWRWIMYDTDFGMAGYNTSFASSNSLAYATDPNGPGWPNPPWSTLMLRKLLENPGFRNQFVNRFTDLMNSTFLSVRVVKAIDEKSKAISGEISAHLLKWKGGNQTTWLSAVQVLRTFANSRPGYVFTHLKQKFSFQTQEIVTVNTDSVAGTIQFNSLSLNSFPWKGSYFPNVPVTLTALPNAGYRFLKWEGITANSNQQTIAVSPKANLKLTAIFESDGSQYDNIVINEISFNNDAQPDPGDWIEIYNKGKEDIDISGWKLSDSDPTHQFVFEANTWIKANEYLVVANDLTKINAVFGTIKKVTGPFAFGLGSETEKVLLYSQYNQLIDEVSYSNVSPWKTFGLTKLWSMELSNPSLNNNIASSWVYTENFGTPGVRNTSSFPVANPDLVVTQNKSELLQNFPNPFREGTSFEIKLNEPGNYRLSVMDVNGRLIRTLNDDDQLSNVHTLYWDGRDNSGKPVISGIYFYRFECDGFSQTKRMVKM